MLTYPLTSFKIQNIIKNNLQLMFNKELINLK